MRPESDIVLWTSANLIVENGVSRWIPARAHAATSPTSGLAFAEQNFDARR